MVHPLVEQLRFTRSEFQRSLEGLGNEDAVKRVVPANCITWNIGHLAWHEQRYWLIRGQDRMLRPDVNERFAYGAEASTPPLADARAAWREITSASDAFLDEFTTEMLLSKTTGSKPLPDHLGQPAAACDLPLLVPRRRKHGHPPGTRP